MRVLVCGDRNWRDRECVEEALRGVEAETDALTVIHGAARGADSTAQAIADFWGWKTWAFPADWKRYGRAAGVIRNQQMLMLGKPDLVLAFHDNLERSRGTKDMVERARKSGVEVRVISHT